MYKTLIYVVLLFAISSAFKTDPEFEKIYKVEIFKESEYHDYPQKGQDVKVHYSGTLTNGKKFDSSKDRNDPFQFKVGVQQVIACWDEVILRMTLGEHVKVLCPSNKAYGSSGAGGLIPPNADLYFEIWMLGFGKHKIEDL